MQADLTISMINHCNPIMLRDCLRSLYAGTHEVVLDVWVLDNATDGTLVPEIQAEFPQIHWLFNAQRQGFSANHNQVLSQATGRYACILNDDTVIHDGALDALVCYMDENPSVGMAGARLLNADGSQQNCTFKFMTLWSEFVGICFLPARLCSLKTCGIDAAQDSNQSALVDWVLGACLVVRRETLEEVGLLDGNLSPIANTEEVDWCYRARKGGWRVGYCPAAVLTHFGGQSTRPIGAGADAMRVEMHRTRLAFFRKHHGAFPTAILRTIYGATLPWNWLMLTQALLRRRLDGRRYKDILATLLQIALIHTMPC